MFSPPNFSTSLRIASRSPDITVVRQLLTAATDTLPASLSIALSTSPALSSTTAIAPRPLSRRSNCDRWQITCAPSPKLSIPLTHAAATSPMLCPTTASGSTPQLASARCKPRPPFPLLPTILAAHSPAPLDLSPLRTPGAGDVTAALPPCSRCLASAAASPYLYSPDIPNTARPSLAPLRSFAPTPAAHNSYLFPPPHPPSLLPPELLPPPRAHSCLQRQTSLCLLSVVLVLESKVEV